MMIIKTDPISTNGGQAGAAQYNYYKIKSLHSGLEGWGLYLSNSDVPVYWSEDEENDLITLMYKNLSLEIPNEDVTVPTFIQFVKDQHSPGRRYIKQNAVSAERYI